jgi:murein DD-endopeptidase MepM/ murein hydrolase activator NlpD
MKTKTTASLVTSLAGLRFAPVIPSELLGGKPMTLDLGAGNQELMVVELDDTQAFTAFIFDTMREQGTPVAIGRYDEDRVVYRHSSLFDDESESRTVHLGIDLFVASGTPVYSPLPARLHSFANNAMIGDYGPTIILEHHLAGITFFTLYGHLSLDSLDGLSEGRTLAAGEQIATIGNNHENGGWPPHLHFQIITDMLGKRGDFPGVATLSERQRFLDLCPDPNLILQLPGLSSG